jgi:flagellar M-ring protein FliF
MSVWSALDTRRRLVVIGATLAMFAAIIGLSRMAAQPSMSLLYAGLDPSSAGQVVAALDQQGVAYDVRAGAIFVESAQRDALRLTLASEGLPANTGQGYEILDNLSGFGTTSQMFDAAYWRAKEGELARTIAANPQISGARVHISNQSSNPFQRDVTPSASVAVTPGSGSLAPAQANAIRYLVASAVTGLLPEDVAVIDARNGTVVASEDAGSSTAASDRAEEMKRNIQRILEARVGGGNAVVEVNVETVTEREAIFERRFDPENRVAVSSDTEERSTSASGSQAAGVTVASNLPDGDAGGGENSSQSENSETRERINYEVSETTRELLREPGAIKRLSIAVLVNGLETEDPATGELAWTPRSEEELTALRDLVASAVGFNEERGDTLTLKSLEFEPIPVSDSGASPSLLQSLNIDTMSLIQLVVLAIVALALGLFVIRPILSAPAAAEDVPLLDAPDDFGSDLPGGMNFNSAFDPAELGDLGGPALNGEIDDGPGPLPGTAVFDAGGMLGGGDGFGLEDDPVERLRQLIDDRKDETIEVLRSWMEDNDQEKA